MKFLKNKKVTNYLYSKNKINKRLNLLYLIFIFYEYFIFILINLKELNFHKVDIKIELIKNTEFRNLLCFINILINFSIF